MLYDEANKSSKCPRLTGIPPHVALLNKMSLVRTTIDDNGNEVVVALRRELNERGIGGETFLANTILDDVRKVHQQMEVIMTGAGRLNSSRGLNGLPVMTEPSTDAPMLVDQGEGQGRRRMYCWGGRLHNVPQNFILPRMTLQTLITYWFCGSNQPHCPPLCHAKPYDFPHKKNMKVVLCQMKRVINMVMRAGEIVHFGFGNGINTTVKATQLYEAVHEFFLYPSIRHKRRYSSISWKTYHNEISKNKGKLVGEV